MPEVTKKNRHQEGGAEPVQARSKSLVVMVLKRCAYNRPGDKGADNQINLQTFRQHD